MRTVTIHTNALLLGDGETPLHGVSVRVADKGTLRSVDLDGLLSFTLTIASGIATGLVANWLSDKLRRRTAGPKSKTCFLKIGCTTVEVIESRAITTILEAELSQVETDTE